jgi:hypothetical protein
MLNLNQVEAGNEQKPLEIIPDRTIARGIINLLGGDTEVPEFGQGNLFKQSMSSSAVYCPMEFTIIGGEHDKRRVWHNLFIHGDKMDSNGVPVARNIGLNTLRLIVDSIHNLGKDDMSAEAQQKRNIAGIQVLQGQEFCFLIGVEPEKNGYPAKNKMTTPLIPGDEGYIAGTASNAAPVGQQGQMPPATASGTVPSWALK